MVKTNVLGTAFFGKKKSTIQNQYKDDTLCCKTGSFSRFFFSKLSTRYAVDLLSPHYFSDQY